MKVSNLLFARFEVKHLLKKGTLQSITLFSTQKNLLMKEGNLDETSEINDIQKDII